MLAELQEIIDECSEQGWDGYGADPVDLGAVSMANSFILGLPSDISIPEFSVDSDGEVSSEWYISKRRLLSISFGPNGGIAYAWIDGKKSDCGFCADCEGSISFQDLLDIIKRFGALSLIKT